MCLHNTACELGSPTPPPWSLVGETSFLGGLRKGERDASASGRKGGAKGPPPYAACAARVQGWARTWTDACPTGDGGGGRERPLTQRLQHVCGLGRRRRARRGRFSHSTLHARRGLLHRLLNCGAHCESKERAIGWVHLDWGLGG